MFIKQRRQKLNQLVKNPVIFWAGNAPVRNFPANRYPFRASSHFLYFAGLSLQNAAIRLENGKLELFIDDAPPDYTLWHGETPKREEIATLIEADAAYPLAELATKTSQAATIPVQDSHTYQHQCHLLNRPISTANQLSGIDLELAKAIISLRLTHDEAALREIRQAVAVSVEAHQAGMQAVSKAKTEAEVRAVMESKIMANNLTCAYNSIVTVHGEVLHNEHYRHFLRDGDLILADVGAETNTGWASDITRTFPVKGKFSPTQRDIYDLILATHDACIAKMRPGIEYQDIHLLAASIIAQGLVDLGILKGNPQDLVAMDAHALFFPHGIGHLLGLDVHDMEDLGDLAGYEAGRSRSKRFGLKYLRLNRPLLPGMVVTIEPGFYQVPGILNHPDFRHQYRQVVNWDKLTQFNDVRGIRIEDDVLITETGTEVLTSQLLNRAENIEALCCP